MSESDPTPTPSSAPVAGSSSSGSTPKARKGPMTAVPRQIAAARRPVCCQEVRIRHLLRPGTRESGGRTGQGRLAAGLGAGRRRRVHRKPCRCPRRRLRGPDGAGRRYRPVPSGLRSHWGEHLLRSHHVDVAAVLRGRRRATVDRDRPESAGAVGTGWDRRRAPTSSRKLRPTLTGAPVPVIVPALPPARAHPRRTHGPAARPTRNLG